MTEVRGQEAFLCPTIRALPASHWSGATNGRLHLEMDIHAGLVVAAEDALSFPKDSSDCRLEWANCIAGRVTNEWGWKRASGCDKDQMVPC
jgi:hypothetical protein